MSNDGSLGEHADVGHGGDDVRNEGCAGGGSQSTEAVIEDSPGVSADVHTVSGEVKGAEQCLCACAGIRFGLVYTAFDWS